MYLHRLKQDMFNIVLNRLFVLTMTDQSFSFLDLQVKGVPTLFFQNFTFYYNTRKQVQLTCTIQCKGIGIGPNFRNREIGGNITFSNSFSHSSGENLIHIICFVPITCIVMKSSRYCGKSYSYYDKSYRNSDKSATPIERGFQWNVLLVLFMMKCALYDC